MYPLRFLLVVGAAVVGLAYVAVGFACYIYGHRRDRTRVQAFGRTVVTFAPAPLLAAAVGFGLQVLSSALTVFVVAAVLLAGGLLVPPARGVMVALDDAAA
ncbi:hypothetical protein [Halorarius halobius]|uniref:hypothetical protein n=1 Tax=Halorarius halobius TaxID=2962671 RepID=UPI0020CF1206|nr:hypothetical protein [Halorarius halobius]